MSLEAGAITSKLKLDLSEWEKGLNEAQKETKQTKVEIEKINKELDKSFGKENQKEVAALKDEVKKVGTELKDTFNSEQKQRIVSHSQEIERGTGTATKYLNVIKGIALALASAWTVRQFSNAVSFADEIAKDARTIGFAAEAFQEYKFAASLAGIGNSEFVSSMEILARSVGQAATGLGIEKEAFDKLNISVKDAKGNLRPIGDVFDDITNRVTKVQSATERAAIMTDLFGRSGARMGLLFEEGAEGIERARARARELGIVLDASVLNNAEAAGDAIEELTTSLRVNFYRVLLELAPAITEIATRLSDLTDVTMRAKDAFFSFGNVESAMSLDALQDKLFDINKEIQAIEARLAEGTAKRGGLFQQLGIPIGFKDDQKELNRLFELRSNILAQIGKRQDAINVANEKYRQGLAQPIIEVEDPEAEARAKTRAALLKSFKDLTTDTSDKLRLLKDETNEALVLYGKLWRQVTDADLNKEFDKEISDAIDSAVDAFKRLQAEQERQTEQKKIDAEWTQRLNQAYSTYNQLIEGNKDELEKLMDVEREIETLWANHKITLDEYNAAMEILREKRAELTNFFAQLKEQGIDVFGSLEDGLTSFLDSVTTGTESLADVWQNLLRSMLHQLNSFLASKAIERLAALFSGQQATSTKASGWGLLAKLGMSAVGFFTGGPAGAAAGSVIANPATATAADASLGLTGFASGIDRVPMTGMYKLHAGERVSTASENARNSEGERPIIYNLLVDEDTANSLARSKQGKNVIVNYISQEMTNDTALRQLVRQAARGY